MEWVLITGSSKGLGRELALVFAKKGFNVIVHGRDEERLKDVQKEILNKGVDCEIVAGDLRDLEVIEELSRVAFEKNVSILVNNAGIGFDKSLTDTELDDIDNILEINLKSLIKLTKVIYNLFLKKGAGLIVNINGMAGLRGNKNHSVYCSSKYGLRGFTDSLRFEAKDFGIRVLGVHLSGMKTDMYKLSGLSDDTCMEPREVAEIIFDLCKKRESLMIDEVKISRMRY